MTSTRRKRSPLSPKPILDQRSLREALDARGLSISENHIENFYASLHRQQYPTLSEFVENHYRDNNKQGPVGDDDENNIENRSAVNHQQGSYRKKNARQLPQRFLHFLADAKNNLTTLTSSIYSQVTSQDRTTTKLIIRLQDDHFVESVIMRHGSSRVTLCVSSQVGCKMGCNFCATGTMGFSGSLSQGEILEQLVHASHVLTKEASSSMDENRGEKMVKPQFESVRNIVFMGMGEPLDNYDNVLAACRVMVDRRRWNLAFGHVTVSTVGIVPKMRQLTRDFPDINLALSLHAPNEVLRQKIVPTSKVYSIHDMIDALDQHMMTRKNNESSIEESQDKINPNGRKKAMIEYVMLNGDTSTFECAHQLGKLCENRHLVVNLIPYNQTDVKDKLSCPSMEHIREFQRIVVSYGVFCTIRTTMGADISGACGQLVVEREKNEKQTLDIEDLGVSHEGKNKMDVKVIKRQKAGKIMAPESESKASKSDSGSDDEADPILNLLVKPLIVSTTIAATCCVASIVALLWIKKKR